MLLRPTHDYTSRSNSCAACREARAAIARKQHQDQTESRVSTDSDLDLESEEDYDGYVDGDNDDHPNAFSADLLVHKLEQVQQQKQQQVSREAVGTPMTPLQQFKLAEVSYWEKMRRISQWRESTHQSEASSDCSPEPEPAPAPPSRKRRLSDASVPSNTKRTRLSVPSPTTPGSPSFPYARAYLLGSPLESASDPGAYPRAFVESARSLDALHVCTACDAAFASRQRLRHHGRGAPDACRAAVTYVLE